MEKREIFFKASRKKSNTYDAYRRIEKSDSEHDIMSGSDDVIVVDVGPAIVSIDCDKKTGTFRLFW